MCKRKMPHSSAAFFYLVLLREADSFPYARIFCRESINFFQKCSRRGDFTLLCLSGYKLHFEYLDPWYRHLQWRLPHR